MENKNIASLGYRLKKTTEVAPIRPLLDACGLDVVGGEFSGAVESAYLLSETPAGGVSASVGWVRYPDDQAVIHSLAVAPSSRGIGLGASLVATAILYLREQCGVQAVYVGIEAGLSDYFSRLGFLDLKSDALSGPIADHPSFVGAQKTTMVRQYGVERHGLDQCAFCLVHNTTEDATLPEGSVFWFRQSGPVLEARYRGGSVRRGHLLGAMEGEALKFMWQSCSDSGELKRGHGEILINLLADGRREMREQPGEDPGELLLREL